VVIGEGEKDEAPMLYCGELLGLLVQQQQLCSCYCVTLSCALLSTSSSVLNSSAMTERLVCAWLVCAHRMP
jgi:hypothetical protein